jgi:glycosyltransferase involved in cell wall biosynthesis
VIPGATGWLVPPGDPEKLAQALAAALDNRSNAETMGKTALSYAELHFSWAASAMATARLYESLVKGGS